MSRFLRSLNWVLAPVSLTLTVLYSRPGQIRSAGTVGMSLCRSGRRLSGRRLRCQAWYLQIMAPTLARRLTSTATRGRYMCSWSTVSAGFLRPGGGAQGRGGVSRGLSASYWVGGACAKWYQGVNSPQSPYSSGARLTVWVQVQLCNILLRVTACALVSSSVKWK